MTLSPKARALSADGPVALVAARPRGGYLVHAIRDRASYRASMGVGRMVIYARPICRGPKPRLSDHLIVGGPYTPTPVEEALTKAPDARYACPACTRLVSGLAAADLLGYAPDVTPGVLPTQDGSAA